MACFCGDMFPCNVTMMPDILMINLITKEPVGQISQKQY